MRDNLPSIGRRDTNLLPLDASWRDKSNELNFILLRLLDDELSLKILKELNYIFSEFKISALMKVSYNG